MTEITKKTI